MAATDKDTIYIDIDDEITGIIDKLRNSEGKGCRPGLTKACHGVPEYCQYEAAETRRR